MNLSDYILNSQIELGFEAETKKQVLKEIARIAKKNDLLKKYSEKDIYKAFEEREKIGSTGLGDKIAIPHCTLKKLDDFVIGIITSPQGVDFQSMDNKKVELIVFVIAPESERNQYIRILSKIAGVLKNKDNVEQMIHAETPEKLKELFLSKLEIIPELPLRKEYIKVEAIIQNEDIFQDILEKFTELEDSSLIVLEGENAGYYLYRSPLFANLWTENEKKFNRMIIAVIPKNIANEFIRNLEKETKKIKSGILITMQEIIYSTGSLEI